MRASNMRGSASYTPRRIGSARPPALQRQFEGLLQIDVVVESQPLAGFREEVDDVARSSCRSDRASSAGLPSTRSWMCLCGSGERKRGRRPVP